MPYEWLPTSDHSQRLHLWPWRSLPRRGFVWFIGATATLITLPLLAVLGTRVLWGLLPFLVLAITGMWWALQRSYRDGEIVEDLEINAARVHLTRHGPQGRHQEWQADAQQVRVNRRATGGPVPQYLTLSGGPREVELGRFLTADERMQLEWELRQRLRALRDQA